jgi:hypothetical protein
LTPAARRRQFRKMELAVLYAPRGKRAAAQNVIQAERLNDLRVKADMTRDGWVPPEPLQADMFAGRPP